LLILIRVNCVNTKTTFFTGAALVQLQQLPVGMYDVSHNPTLTHILIALIFSFTTGFVIFDEFPFLAYSRMFCPTAPLSQKPSKRSIKNTSNRKKHNEVKTFATMADRLNSPSIAQMYDALKTTRADKRKRGIKASSLDGIPEDIAHSPDEDVRGGLHMWYRYVAMCETADS
jgi:hypothetical protein